MMKEKSAELPSVPFVPASDAQRPNVLEPDSHNQKKDSTAPALSTDSQSTTSVVFVANSNIGPNITVFILNTN
jgi:hypothetical protein